MMMRQGDSLLAILNCDTIIIARGMAPCQFFSPLYLPPSFLIVTEKIRHARQISNRLRLGSPVRRRS